MAKIKELDGNEAYVLMQRGQHTGTTTLCYITNMTTLDEVERFRENLGGIFSDCRIAKITFVR